jgi:hypothetical protein
VGIGWLGQTVVDRWPQGRLGYLEQAVSIKPSKVSEAFRLLDNWARSRA